MRTLGSISTSFHLYTLNNANAHKFIGTGHSSTHHTYTPGHDLRNNSSLFHPSPIRLPPCKVTNEGKELRVKKLIQEAGIDDDEYIIVDPINLGPNPELGPLERQVSINFEEGLAQEEIDVEAMNYWFTEPAGGWKTEKRRLKKIVPEPLEQFHDLRHHSTPHMEDAIDHSNNEESPSPYPGQPRRSLSELRVGDVLQGVIVRQMLYHGLQVDVGFEADGLIAICELDQWRAVGSGVPDIDDVLEVVVYAVRDDPVFRFPLQLMPKDERLASKMPPPEGHIPPLDLREVPVSRYEEIAQKAGRRWEMQKVMVGPAREEDMPLEDGVTVNNYNSMREEDEEEWSEERMRELDDIVAGKYYYF